MQLRILILFMFLYLSGQSMMAQKTVKMFGLRQPIIAAKLNGKKAYFLIDTGADITVLNSKQIKKYKLKTKVFSGVDFRLSGLVSEYKGDIMITKGAELNIGDQKIRGAFKVFDLTGIVNSLANDGNLRITGIIGCDVMRKHKFIIDYEAKEITFKDR